MPGGIHLVPAFTHLHYLHAIIWFKLLNILGTCRHSTHSFTKNEFDTWNQFKEDRWSYARIIWCRNQGRFVRSCTFCSVSKLQRFEWVLKVFISFLFQGVCTEAGMYALRERRVHVTQEDFEMAVAKVNSIFFLRYSMLEWNNSVLTISSWCMRNICRYWHFLLKYYFQQFLISISSERTIVLEIKVQLWFGKA